MSLNIEVLEQSFERVKPQASDFAFSFYQNLLTDYPQLRPLFAKTNMEQQQQKLMMSLVLVIENLRNPDYLRVILKNLGERHVSYHTVQEHYPMVGAALLKTFEAYLGSGWTPEVKQAWTDAYGAIVDLMLEGAKSAEISEPENAVQHTTQPVVVVRSEAPTQFSEAANTLNYSDKVSQLQNGSKPSDNPVATNKALTQATTNSFSLNNSQTNSQLDNRSQPREQPDVIDTSIQASTNTTWLNLKLLLLIFVVAGLLGVGLMLFQRSSKQNNSSLKSFVVKHNC